MQRFIIGATVSSVSSGAPNISTIGLPATAEIIFPRAIQSQKARHVSQLASRKNSMSGDHSIDPRRYFELVERDRAEIAGRDPVCLYLETTNRCNLPCTTCPLTANRSWRGAGRLHPGRDGRARQSPQH